MGILHLMQHSCYMKHCCLHRGKLSLNDTGYGFRSFCRSRLFFHPFIQPQKHGFEPYLQILRLPYEMTFVREIEKL